MDIIRYIETNYDLMSATDKIISNYILEHSDVVINANIHKMAEELNISPASISRFVSKHFNITFAELKIDLATNMNDGGTYNRAKEIYSWADSSDKLPINIIESITKVCYDVLATNDAAVFQTAVDWINKAESVIFFGLGASSTVIIDFQQKLTRLEKRCIYNVDSNFGVLNSKITSNRDVVIAVSNSGRTKEVNLAVRESKKSGVKVIAITRNAASELSEMADLKIVVPSAEYNETRLASIFSRYGQLFIVDILFLSLAKKTTESVEKFVTQYRDLLDKLKQ